MGVTSMEGAGAHDRAAELNAQANAYIELAARAAAEGSPVAAREWLEASEAALRAAASALQSSDVKELLAGLFPESRVAR